MLSLNFLVGSCWLYNVFDDFPENPLPVVVVVELVVVPKMTRMSDHELGIRFEVVPDLLVLGVLVVVGASLLLCLWLRLAPGDNRLRFRFRCRFRSRQ